MMNDANIEWSNSLGLFPLHNKLQKWDQKEHKCPYVQFLK